jgi:hypothetical protein
VRPSPNGGKRNGEERARWQLLPRRGDGVGGAAEFSVRGGAPMVGAVEKATGRGFLTVGCFGVRTEGWGGNRGTLASGSSLLSGGGVRQGRVGVEEIRRRVEGEGSRARGSGPDRRGTARAARRVRTVGRRRVADERGPTGSRNGPVERGTWHLGRPGKKRSGPSLSEQ